jgi:hypothetical protein
VPLTRAITVHVPPCYQRDVCDSAGACASRAAAGAPTQSARRPMSAQKAFLERVTEWQARREEWKHAETAREDAKDCTFKVRARPPACPPARPAQ